MIGIYFDFDGTIIDEIPYPENIKDVKLADKKFNELIKNAKHKTSFKYMYKHIIKNRNYKVSILTSRPEESIAAVEDNLELNTIGMSVYWIGGKKYTPLSKNEIALKKLIFLIDQFKNNKALTQITYIDDDYSLLSIMKDIHTNMFSEYVMYFKTTMSEEYYEKLIECHFDEYNSNGYEQLFKEVNPYLIAMIVKNSIHWFNDKLYMIKIKEDIHIPKIFRYEADAKKYIENNKYKYKNKELMIYYV